MKKLRYISGVASLNLDQNLCIGCRTCSRVCPHAVFSYQNSKAVIEDGDGCMECGACARNCEQNALTVQPGVGCAAYVIQTWIKGKDAACCGDIGCC